MNSFCPYICALTLALSIQLGWSQEEVIGGLTQDSTLYDSNVTYEAESGERQGFFAMFEGKPGRAALYSAIIPGAGQIYNKRWLKVPIVWGLEAGAVGFISYYSVRYNAFDLCWKGLARGEIDTCLGYTSAAAAKVERDKFKKFRDYSYVGLIVAHILNITDAFVDRHLIEFDVNEDISFRLGPTQHGVGMVMNFK